MKHTLVYTLILIAATTYNVDASCSCYACYQYASYRCSCSDSENLNNCDDILDSYQAFNSRTSNYLLSLHPNSTDYVNFVNNMNDNMPKGYCRGSSTCTATSYFKTTTCKTLSCTANDMVEDSSKLCKYIPTFKQKIVDVSIDENILAEIKTYVNVTNVDLYCSGASSMFTISLFVVMLSLLSVITLI